ncbi:MAG: acetylornithine carbamoyltransferase [Bacteroidetes bacterium]|nr:acetylornithine carbamoyltransferase [Bacteroidota bacterium]
MKKYTTVTDLIDPLKAAVDALSLKASGQLVSPVTEGKVLCLLFFNNSLRTRLSTELAGIKLGMKVMVMQIGESGWALEFEDGVRMDSTKAEHIKEAAAVVSQYADIIGIRSFPTLTDKEADLSDRVISAFVRHASVPVFSMEGAVQHPLQALADAMTILEHQRSFRPKVVLSWAPHPIALPHAVANSFITMMQRQEVDFCITHPKGYELDPLVVGNTPVVYDQDNAMAEADFVYVKNWSQFEPYGATQSGLDHWMITPEKLGDAKFMHCLPLRRNVIASDSVLDSEQSLVVEQANNRTFSAAYIIKKLLESKGE